LACLKSLDDVTELNPSDTSLVSIQSTDSVTVLYL